jgi:AAA domain
MTSFGYIAMTDFANHRAIGLGHDVEFRGPAEKARGERTKANGHASGQDGDRFKWKTAQTTEGPILSGLWLVKGVIPCRGVGAMFGRPGCGKTFVGTDIGLCVAGAIEWRGLKVRQCETVMLSMEAGQAGENRVHAWMRYHSRPWPPEFRMSPVTLNFRSTRADAEALVLDIASRGKKVGLIIVDTLATPPRTWAH